MTGEKNMGFHIINGVQSELLKMRRTFTFWVHFALPLAGVLLFSLYYSRMQVWDALTKSSAYLQMIGAAYPFVIGVVCPGSVQLEENVGMQFLSGTGRRKTAGLLLKLGTLLLMSLLSTALAVAGFGGAFGIVLGQDQLGMPFYFKVTMMIFLSGVVLYLFHLFLSLQFSRAASIGAGIAESLLSALLLTGLGEGIWYYIPCAWAARLAEYTMRLDRAAGMSREFQAAIRQEFAMGVACMAVITAAAFLLFLVWFHYFEGRKGIE